MAKTANPLFQRMGAPNSSLLNYFLPHTEGNNLFLYKHYATSMENCKRKKHRFHLWKAWFTILETTGCRSRPIRGKLLAVWHLAA
jgi:hypothetical protein